jgi:hypothetical protein
MTRQFDAGARFPEDGTTVLSVKRFSLSHENDEAD